MPVLSMKQLLETGVHFGHRTRKWNPLMKPYIFTERNRIHIIDLQRTMKSLDIAYSLVRDTVAASGTVLFVGTKRQAQETIEAEGVRCSMPYVNMRWLGGTLTNWRTISARIEELETLERRQEAGEFEHLTKKEALLLQRKIERLDERLGGIREMHKVPDLLFVVDVRREETAVHEANLLEIPVVALVDTNCDPRGIDYIIPSNDDAIRAIKLLTGKIADAVLEGVALRKDDDLPEDEKEMAEAEMAVEMTDEELLGEATLAKIQSGEYGKEGGPQEAPPEEDSAKKAAGSEKEAEEPAEEQPTEKEEESSAEPKDEGEEKKSKPSKKKPESKKEADEPAEELPAETGEEASVESKDEGETKKSKPSKKKVESKKEAEEPAEEQPTEKEAEASAEPKDEGDEKKSKPSKKKAESKKE